MKNCILCLLRKYLCWNGYHTFQTDKLSEKCKYCNTYQGDLIYGKNIKNKFFITKRNNKNGYLWETNYIEPLSGVTRTIALKKVPCLILY